MADDDLPSKSYGGNKKENDSDSEQHQQIRLDLGDNNSSRNPEINRLGNSSNGPSVPRGVPICMKDKKREDNPFSFKHFLRSDSGGNYQSKGARPKVYSENRAPLTETNSQTSESKQPRVIPELSSALPDFVQDHLVIEQCYLGNNSSNNYNLNVANLPDFAHSGDNRSKYKDGCSAHEGGNNVGMPIPLDLPIRPQGSFPLDLPIGNIAGGSRNSTSSGEVGNSKSLPDFLTDSAVCSQKGDNVSASHSPESESERLRHELELTKRQLGEQTQLCECLSRELEIARNKEHEYTQNLAKALGQVEDSLQKSNRRAVSAENTVLKLKQEVKALTMQIGNLKLENQSLRGEEAAGGHGYYSPPEMQSLRLAQELRSAASSAEHSLRQLLTGVDNLRIMAASLENMHRIEEKSDPFSNFDEDAGPAL
ncbi:hypothetical protein NQ317_018985 [Molorchus minor]|uniref:Endosome-associated-trafficking regulator 1 n=1 Tax=Molorchus minor TaxID=1323400 RepID=A0ABQ9JC05_9CUCU|nr:hypothetical protein NQ317_018985 [Molorchus minor]